LPQQPGEQASLWSRQGTRLPLTEPQSTNAQPNQRQALNHERDAVQAFNGIV
jgi:hypothetical protein